MQRMPRITSRERTVETWNQAAQHHLEPDEDQDEGHARLEVMELVHRARQHEEQRPEPEDGEDVRGVDDERIAGHREDGGDAVDGEDQIAPLHDQQDQQQRGGQPPRGRALHEEVLSFVGRRDGEEPAGQAHERVLLRLDPVVVARGTSGGR